MLPTSCQFNELRWKICFKIALLNATYTMAHCQPLVLAPMLTWLPSKAWRSWIFTPRRLYFSYAAMHLLVKYTYVQICCCKNVNCRRMRHVAQFRELQRKNREKREPSRRQDNRWLMVWVVGGIRQHEAVTML